MEWYVYRSHSVFRVNQETLVDVGFHSFAGYIIQTHHPMTRAD